MGGRRMRQFRSDMRPGVRPSDRDLGDALHMIFGSREEMQETFREWEAALVKTIDKAVEQAKRVWDKEWPIPPDDEPPAADHPVQPAVKAK